MINLIIIQFKCSFLLFNSLNYCESAVILNINFLGGQHMDLKEANKIIGNTYKQIRKSKKFTQEEVAEKSDLTPEYLSKFENGKYNASIYNIILLCKAIDTNPTQLFNQFFEDNSIAIVTTITDELKDMDISDQQLILNLIRRLKNKANI